MRIIGLLVALLFSEALGWTAEERIIGLLRPMTEGGSIPSDKEFWETLNDDYVNSLSQDSVREVLQFAGKLLNGPRPEATRYGLLCFLSVTLRRSQDSEPVLEPYVPDLLRIASDRTNPLWTIATQVVSNTWPKLSPKTIAFLSTHLGDKANTPADTARIAHTLFLRSGSDAVIHEVIEFLQKQAEPKVAVLVLMGLHAKPPTRNPDILDYIGSNLDNPDASVRIRAVEAAADLRMAERALFLAQLNRLSIAPNEPSEIRLAAAEAIKRK